MNLQEAFNACTAEGDRIYLPSDQIENYDSFKKVMSSNLGKWVKGKDQAFQFPYDAEVLLDKLKAGERPNFKKDYDYFPTPIEVVDRMYQITVPINQTVLEPSAGDGAIAEYMRTFCPWGQQPDCVEIHPINRAKLQKKGLNIVGDDFMKFTPEFEYGICIANPPFKYYREHLYRMMQCAEEVICIVPSSYEYASDKKTAELRDLIGKMDSSIYKMDEGSFKGSGTMVSTLIISIREVDRNLIPFITDEPEKIEKNQLTLF